MRGTSAAYGRGERLHRQRLGEAGDAFDEQMALRQHGDDHALEEVILADDDVLHLVEHALHQGRSRRGSRCRAGCPSAPV